jgi:hypothetical protein
VPVWGAQVTIEASAWFLAARLKIPYETERTTRDKTRKLIVTALNSGRLSGSKTAIGFDALIKWAKTKRTLESGVRNLNPPATGCAAMTLPSMTVQSSGYSIPGSLEACKASLVDAFRELIQLRQEIASLHARVQQLEPFEAKAIARSAKAQASGRKGGRPRS